MTLLPINQLQYKPKSEGEAADGRTLGQYDPMVWKGVRLMVLGFALLFVVALLFHLGGWF